MDSSLPPFFQPKGVVVIGASTTPEKLGYGVARKIAPHAGVVKSVLRLFDDLVKCDSEGILKDVRAVQVSLRSEWQMKIPTWSPNVTNP
jgi:hypothetical protein